jgi:hypothetical protein
MTYENTYCERNDAFQVVESFSRAFIPHRCFSISLLLRNVLLYEVVCFVSAHVNACYDDAVLKVSHVAADVFF